MAITTALAVLGAATGVTGTVLSALNYRRDRAILKLSTSTLSNAAGEMYVVVEVRNEGRHGITLTGLGLLVIQPDKASSRGLRERIPVLGAAKRIRRMRSEGVFYNDLNYLVDDTTEGDYEPFLEPGHSLSLRTAMTEAHGRTSHGREAWPCAEDFTGKNFLGSQRAHVQAVIERPFDSAPSQSDTD